TSRREPLAFGFNKLNICAPRALRQPNVTHRGKLKRAEHYLLTLAKIQGAGDAVDACRSAAHNGNFIRIGVNESSKRCSRRLIPLHPYFPWRTLLMPTRKIILK